MSLISITQYTVYTLNIEGIELAITVLRLV